MTADEQANHWVGAPTAASVDDPSVSRGWETSPESDLGRHVREIHDKHLRTYLNDPVRVTTDQRGESEVLEAAYRHRQVVELIQNGADALRSIPDGGRIEVVLTDDTLYVANQGEPLTRDGVTALLYRGISPKTSSEIGRLGVGFKSVLEVSSTPYFLSRTVSLSFDAERSRRAIEETLGRSITRAPAMRLAEVVDPHDLAGSDPVLEPMLNWASSVVLLPLDQPHTDWLPETLTEAALRSEFLLFSPQVRELVLDDRRNDVARRLRCDRDGNTIELRENDGEPTAWQVRRSSVKLSDDARRDGGERFGREELELAWAVPHTPDVARTSREMWAFFPIPGVSSSLPGILNSGWKLSEDRGNIVEGELNEQLLGEAARLVVDHLPELAPENRPGYVLELLPAPPAVGSAGWANRAAAGAGWAGPVLQEEVWSIAPLAAIVPSVGGTWRTGGQLRMWPEWVNKAGGAAIANKWQESLKNPDVWVHRSVMTDLRAPRARRLGCSDSTTNSWLEALRDEESALRSSAAALELALDLLEESVVGTDQLMIGKARVSLSAAGTWVPIEDVRLDGDAPEDLTPARGTRALVKSLHKRLGIAADFDERTLVELAGRPMDDDDASLFWQTAHGVGVERAERALRRAASLKQIPVRCADGEFRTRDDVLLPGAAVNADEDPHACVDTRFHSNDGPLLDRIGLVDRPQLTGLTGSNWPEPFNTYRWRMEERWRRLQFETRRRMPHSGTGVVSTTGGEIRRPTHSAVFGRLSPQGRARWTTLLLESEDWTASWSMNHRTQHRVYTPLTIPSPTAWLLRGAGVLETTAGLRPVSETVSPALGPWGHHLPIAPLSHEAAEALELPSRLEQVDDEQRENALRSLFIEADSSVDPIVVELLLDAANAGWQPPSDAELPPLSDSRSTVDAMRAQGQPVWFCQRAHLASWPEGWQFSVVDQPPAIPFGDADIYGLEEYLPAVIDLMDDGAPRPEVWECDRVSVGGLDVLFGRSDAALLVTRGAERGAAVRWVAQQVADDLDESTLARLVSAEVSAACEALVKRVSTQLDDMSRLVELLGAEGLRQAVESLIEWPLADEPAEHARALLTVYGPSALQRVSRLIPEGLGVPRQWAGGYRTIEFVRRLGFPEAYAGRRRAERQDEERVLGPVVAGKLHPFQKEISVRVHQLLRDHSNGIVDLPTGAGKTRVAIESLLDWADERGGLGIILWVAEREELCEQAITQWAQLWRGRGLKDMELTLIRYFGGRSPGEPESGADCVVVASRQQLHNRLGDPRTEWLKDADVLVIDEAHHSTASTYLQIKRWRTERSAEPFALIGLSATPFRANEDSARHLANLYDRSLISGSLMGDEWKDRIAWLQKEKYLSRIDREDLDRGYIEPTEDEAKLLEADPNLSTGIDQLNQRLGTDELRNRQILESILALDDDWPIVVFAGSVTHAQFLADALVEAGVPSRPVWGDLARWARRDAIEQFRTKRIRVLTNFNVLSEGFDAPRTRAVVIARLVQSDGLFLQMLGRGMRGPKNGGTKRCLLVTTGERLPQRFDRDGQLDINRYDYLWSAS